MCASHQPRRAVNPTSGAVEDATTPAPGDGGPDGPHPLWSEDGRRELLAETFERVSLADTGVEVKRAEVRIKIINQARELDRDTAKQTNIDQLRAELREMRALIGSQRGEDRASTAVALPLEGSTAVN